MDKVKIELNKVSEEELLNTKICDLPLEIAGTWIETCVHKLYDELAKKNIKFLPEVYFADEWLAPNKEPVVGIPFYLAHNRLMKLEDKIMLDVEGGNKRRCMMLLRHEAGHAINYAYKLFKRKQWKGIFGDFSKEYKDSYKFRPYSKSFVRHLEDYYAQYHPDEDFAETFAVWLDPLSAWRRKYSGWKALEKLEYVDRLMSGIANKDPLVAFGKKYWAAKTLKIKLKNYYKKRREYVAEDFPDFHDENLKKIFHMEKTISSMPVHLFLNRHKKEIISSISLWSGERKYVISDILSKILKRAKELELFVQDPFEEYILRVAVYLTAMVMNYRHTGKLKGI
ncbi:MAG: putative zinc-binding metallopeptidase [Candidatus Omnitrophica bacterium]|nr:putative zinc-binding metallopeptidase [Candidatus Omnitrophota bacterium]MDD5080928.1 putative zinc-binding metallopeptidase [Candidatus Omnitrophota bacterium]